MKIWAILEEDYEIAYPVILADSLESIQKYIEKFHIESPTIVYKEISEWFKCILGNDGENNWNYWSGEKYLRYFMCNKITGEVIPESEFDFNSYDLSWDAKLKIEVYKEGKVINTIYD